MMTLLQSIFKLNGNFFPYFLSPFILFTVQRAMIKRLRLASRDNKDKNICSNALENIDHNHHHHHHGAQNVLKRKFKRHDLRRLIGAFLGCDGMLCQGLRGVFKGGFWGSKTSFLGKFFNLLWFLRKKSNPPLNFPVHKKKFQPLPSKKISEYTPAWADWLV